METIRVVGETISSQKKGGKPQQPAASRHRSRETGESKTNGQTRSASRFNDRRRSFTFSDWGFSNASADPNGKNNRTNCN